MPACAGRGGDMPGRGCVACRASWAVFFWRGWRINADHAVLPAGLVVLAVRWPGAWRPAGVAWVVGVDVPA